MANAQKVKWKKRLRKMRGVRRTVRGTTERPRLSVHRSCKYIYAQVIDDSQGRTLAAASQLEQDLKSKCEGTKSASAKTVGEALAARLKERGIERVVFDRGWYRYHGRVKALAEAVRQGGIHF